MTTDEDDQKKNPKIFLSDGAGSGLGFCDRGM